MTPIETNNHVAKAEKTDADLERLSAHLQARLDAELLRQFSRRLLLSALLLACVVFLLQAQHAKPDLFFGLFWLALAVLQIVAQLILFKSKHAQRRLIAAFLSCSITLSWWILYCSYAPAELHLSLSILFLLQVASGTLAWPLPFNICLGMLFFFSGLWRISTVQQPMLYLGLILFFCLLQIRAAARSYIFFQLHNLAIFLTSLSSFAPSAESLLRLLAQQISKVLGGAPSLLIFKQDRAEIIKTDSHAALNLSPTYLKGFAVRIDEAAAVTGVISRKSLGQQYFPMLQDSFANLPNHLVFARLEAVIAEQDQKAYLVFALNQSITLASTTFFLHVFNALSANLQVMLTVQRSRFLSSGVLSATERSINEQEYELNEVIHLVNNASQDVTILCDSSNQILEQMQSADTSSPHLQNLKDNLEKLEGTVSHLSREVSDIKLLRELLRVRESAYSELVDIASLADELNIYSKHRSYRRSETFQLENKVSASTAVRVQSREYLETILRLFIREASSRLIKSGEIRVTFQLLDQTLRIIFEDNGTEASDAPASERTGTFLTADPQYLEAARLFFELNRGQLRKLEAEGAFQNRISCELPAVKNSAEFKRLSNQWVLLVDDKLEVTTFYARIAEALNLSHVVASSTEEALKVIDNHGKPRLIITDLQLGEGSGWQLIAEIRRRFGPDLPVIVVSGETEDNRDVSEAKRLGVVTYLSKPVGRRSLFAEIQEILTR